MCTEGINQNATVEGKKYGTNIFTFEQRSHHGYGTKHQSQRQWDGVANRILSVTSDAQVSKCVALFGECRECTVKSIILISGFTYVMLG